MPSAFQSCDSIDRKSMCVSELPYGGGRLTVPKTSTHFGFQDLCDRPEAGSGHSLRSTLPWASPEWTGS